MANYNLDEIEQKNIIEHMFSEPSIYSRIRPILKPEYFDKKFQHTINYLDDFSNQYNTLPTLEQLNVESRIEFKHINGLSDNHNLQTAILSILEKFCKKRALEIAIEEAYGLIAKGETSGIDKIIKDAQSISLSKDMGMNFWENPSIWLKQQESEQGILPTGWKTFDERMNGGFGWGELNYVVAPANSGKCEIAGTKIRMFDGSVKNIEDIIVGDKLMGIDSTPRTVKALARGKEKLYEIDYGQGKMTVTGEHTLYFETHSIENVGQRVEMTVIEFMKKIEEDRDSFLKYSMIYTAYCPSTNTVAVHSQRAFIHSIKQKDYEEDYYGFELDGDRLYIHEDGIVTHNSLCMQNLAINWSMMGYNVLFFTLEMNRRLVGKRMASMVSNVPYRDIRLNIENVSNSIIYKRKNISPGLLQLVDLPIGCTANDIESFIKTFEIDTNIIPQILCIDYADIMTPCDKRIKLDNLNLVDKMISLELRDIARERTRIGKNTMVLTASQITKDAMDEMEFGMSKIAGGTTKSQNADNIFSIRTNDAMRQRGEYEFKFLKTRNSGAKDSKLKMKYNVDTLLISDLEEIQVQNPLGSNDQSVNNALATLKGLANK